MLSAHNRLAKLSDIQRVFKTGNSVSGRGLILKIAKNRKNNSRFTVIVSLKVSKKAVDRNRVKRKIREAIRKEIVPKIKTGYDVVVITKSGMLTKNFEETSKEVINVFEKAKLI